MLFICAVFCISLSFVDCRLLHPHNNRSTIYFHTSLRSAVILTSKYIYFFNSRAPWSSASFISIGFFDWNLWVCKERARLVWSDLERHEDTLHHLNLCQPICYVHLEDVSVCLCHIDLSPLNYMTFLENKNNRGTDGEGVGWRLSVLSLGFKSRT